MQVKKLALLLVLSILIIPVLGKTAGLSGRWENDIYISPTPNPIDSFEGTLGLNYSIGNFVLGSVSYFKKDHFEEQTFKLNYPLGFLDTDTKASFDPSQARLEYWITSNEIEIAESKFYSDFLIEHVNKSEGFGAGLKIGLSSGLAENLNFDLYSHFGMEEDEEEKRKIVRGSGYDIVFGEGKTEDLYRPSQLQYVNTQIEINGLWQECCEYSTKTRFSQDLGYEYSEIDFKIEPKMSPLILDTEMKLTTRLKSFKIKPTLDLNWACFDAYTNFTGPLVEEDEEGSQITGIELEGFGFSNIKLGYLNFNSLTSLKDHLYRPVNKSDMDLRTEDYILHPTDDEKQFYEKTEFNEIFSIVKSGDLYLAMDFYFNMKDSENLFDIALFTGDAKYPIGEQFNLGTAVAIQPRGINKFRLSLDFLF